VLLVLQHWAHSRNTRPRPPPARKRSLPYFGCDFSGRYNSFRKIVKTLATRGHILKLKCTKFDFGWGSVPDPAGGELTALPPDSLAGFKGACLLLRGREWEREGKERALGEGKWEEMGWNIAWSGPLA